MNRDSCSLIALRLPQPCPGGEGLWYDVGRLRRYSQILEGRVLDRTLQEAIRVMEQYAPEETKEVIEVLRYLLQ